MNVTRVEYPYIYTKSLNCQNPHGGGLSTVSTPAAFIKSPLKTDTISFSAAVVFSDNSFEKTYSRNFFKKLVKEGVPCAYTGMLMIPRSDVDDLINSQVFKKKSSVAIQYLKPYKDQMFDIEKRVFEILEKEAKKHPDLKLQELLLLKYPMAEKALIAQQSAVLDRINLIARGLPRADYLKVRQFINSSFDKIFEPNQLPEERFKRKEFIYQLKALKLNDKRLLDKMLKEADKLPQSSTSVNAFIVKYSQPYKLKYNADGSIKKMPRDSEELALRLLRPSVATEDHIYPQELYRLEELKRQKGNKDAEGLSDMKVTILTTEYINGLKTNILFDDFVKNCKYDVKTNVQKHVDRLIEICKKWENEGKINDANRLADYIIILKEEFQRRSEIVDINIEELEKELPQLQSKVQEYNQKMVQKRLKSTGRADNSHSETYIDTNGHEMENRKLHKHIPRFK